MSDRWNEIVAAMERHATAWSAMEDEACRLCVERKGGRKCYGGPTDLQCDELLEVVAQADAECPANTHNEDRDEL